MDYYLGIDLGGTSIKLGAVDKNYNIAATERFRTDLPKKDYEIADMILWGFKRLLRKSGLKREMFKSAGIGSPGIIDPDKGLIVYASNFGFENVQMAKLLSQKLRMPVYIENDANCAAYGEMLCGAAAGCSDVIMVTIGTGVGGGIINSGKIYSGFNKMGGELGHTGIVFNGRHCPCGRKGCVEMYCSATALKKTVEEAMYKNKSSRLWKMCQGKTSNITGKIIFDALKKGDKAAKGAVSKYLEYLGYAVVNYINTFQPEILIIGGGISSQGENITKPLQEYADKYALKVKDGKNTVIRTAALGNDAGIIGAAMLGVPFPLKPK